jgi:hypothetical protein
MSDRDRGCTRTESVARDIHIIIAELHSRLPARWFGRRPVGDRFCVRIGFSAHESFGHGGEAVPAIRDGSDDGV